MVLWYRPFHLMTCVINNLRTSGNCQVWDLWGHNEILQIQSVYIVTAIWLRFSLFCASQVIPMRAVLQFYYRRRKTKKLINQIWLVHLLSKDTLHCHRWVGSWEVPDQAIYKIHRNIHLENRMGFCNWLTRFFLFTELYILSSDKFW